MVLNSPWLDMQGGPLLRISARRRSSGSAPAADAVVPRTVTGFYARSLHLEHEGEWEFDLDWKPIMSFPVFAGWLRAIRLGHAELHAGLDVGCPALVLSSGGTPWPRRWARTCTSTTSSSTSRRSGGGPPPSAGTSPTSAIDGARHDVVLSRPESASASTTSWTAG